MSFSGLDSEQKKAILTSGGCTTGLPNEAYTSVEFFEWEKKNLFANTWTCIGSACDVADVGSLKPVGFLGAPLVMVRNKNNEVNVFHNVCSHRGNELVWEACKVNGLISCPYHSWTYDLDGSLKATPHVGGTGVHVVTGLYKSMHGLKPVRSQVWMGLVFVNLSEDALDFEDFIEPLQQRMNKLASADQFEKLNASSTHGSLTIEFEGNWKLCIENNLESYHLPWVHPDLNSVSKLEDHYHFYGETNYAGQGSKEYDHTKIHNKNFPMFDNWPEKVAEYPTLYPNVFLGFHCDHYWTRIIEPVSPTFTRDHLQIYYLGESSESDEYEEERKVRMDTWAKVFYEDIGVVQGMQRGRKSPAFKGGVFTPLMDEPSHHFAKWVAKQL
jgi:choline monooxygenase